MRPSLVNSVRLINLRPPFYVNPKTVTSVSVPGYNHFTQPVRKIVFEYHFRVEVQEGLREWLRTSVIPLAEANPQTEFVIRSNANSVARGGTATAYYTNGNVRKIRLQQARPDTVGLEVKKLLEASGKPIVPLKNRTVDAERYQLSARGIWSGMHLPSPFNI